MENSGGKISFGFSKISKKPNLLKPNPEALPTKAKVELIDSIEGSSVLFQGKKPDEKQDEKLVIKMTNDQKTRPIAKLMSSRKIKKEVDDIEKNLEKSKIENGNNETLEQRAAREIIENLQNQDIKTETKILELPIHPDELPLEGAVEPTADDYERIPIADFGKAMLRGMGWKDEEQKEKIFDTPAVRPKGLGLGADKVVKKQPLLVAPAQNETLEIKRNACVKILAGKHKNLYGTIEGFDDGAGRIIVKLAIGALKIIMNEFMVQPVSKQEFAKYGKILNSEKYEEFKNSDTKKERKSRSVSPQKTRQASPSTSRNRDRKSQSVERSSRDKSRRRSRDRRRHSSDSEDDKTNNRKYNERQRSRSNDRHRRRYSDSDSDSGRHHHSKKKSSKKHSKSSKKYSPDLYKSSDDERKHKRKYKRSKHHRDRS